MANSIILFAALTDRERIAATMHQRTIAIGDIHGCAKALRKLLEIVQPQASDRIVTLGDYVDRGPDSRNVIDQLIELSQRCDLIRLLGNHELMMLATRNDPSHATFWEQCGGRETLASYGGGMDQIPASHWEFLESCLPHFETETHLFVHANYAPTRPLDECSQTDLFWRHLHGQATSPHQSGKQVILGHTPQPGQILDLGHVVCIDTFCFGDGCLTAYEVGTGQQWQVDKSGQVWSPSDPA